MTPRPLTMSAADWLMLVVLSILWGGSFYLNKLAVAELPPLTVALGRVGIAAIVLVSMAWMRGELWPLRTAWPVFLTLGLINSALPFFLVAWGQTQIASGLASILNATTPLFAVVIANAATIDDKLTPSRAVGIVCGLIGVVVMIGPGALKGLSLHVVGELACLAAAALYATGTVYARRFRSFTPNALAAGQTGAATLLLLAPVAYVDHPWTHGPPVPHVIAALIGLGAFSTAVAYLLYFRLLARAGATNTSLVTFLIPVTAVLLGALALGERLEPHQIAGMAVIAVGLVAIDGRAAHALAHRRGRRKREQPNDLTHT